MERAANEQGWRGHRAVQEEGEDVTVHDSGYWIFLHFWPKVNADKEARYKYLYYYYYYYHYYYYYYYHRLNYRQNMNAGIENKGFEKG